MEESVESVRMSWREVVEGGSGGRGRSGRGGGMMLGMKGMSSGIGGTSIPIESVITGAASLATAADGAWLGGVLITAWRRRREWEEPERQ